MRLFTLALPLAAALVLVLPANAARPPKVTTHFSGTPVFVSTPSADSIHRDVTLTVPFTHKGTVAIQFTITFDGVAGDPGASRIFSGIGNETFTWSIPGTDCLAPEPGDTVSYHLALVTVVRGPHGWSPGTVLDELTTDTFVIT